MTTAAAAARPLWVRAGAAILPRMNRAQSWLVAALLLCPLGAQDQPAPGNTEAVKQRLEELKAEQKQIVKDWQDQRANAAKAAEEAAAAGKPIPAMRMRPDFSPLLAKFVAAAKEFGGKDAVQFLVPAVNLGETAEDVKQVFDLLLDGHLDDLDGAAAATVGQMLPYLDRVVDADYAKAAFAKIERHGKNFALLAWIAFGQNESALRTQPVDSPEFGATRNKVAAAIAKAGDQRLQRQFDQLITELTKFGIGMTAPDIDGVDLDGVAFKLRDYQGKVVFLDFWGDW